MGYYKEIFFLAFISFDFYIKCKEVKHPHLKKSHHKDAKKRDVNEKDSNTMLMFDSSNGFQRAIQKDIDDLNNPVMTPETKRSDVPDSLTNQNKAGDDAKNYIPELIIDQIRYVTAIEREKQKYTCLVNNNANCHDDTKLQIPPAIPVVNTAPSTTNEKTMNNQPVNPQETNTVANQPAQPQTYQLPEGFENHMPEFRSQQNLQQPQEQTQQPLQSLPSNQQIVQPNLQENAQNQPLNATNTQVTADKQDTSTYCGEWSEWGHCTDICKDGIMMRYRECYQSNMKTIQKDIKACSNPECSYCTEWTPFTSCNKICGQGVKTKLRTCVFKNGTSFQDKIEEDCNFHPCQPQCEPWGDWSQCSKECDTGVKIRSRSCTLADLSKKIFYEHKACYIKPCVRTDKNISIFTEDDEEMCLSAHITFERFQYNAYTAYDNTHEHNDIKYENMILFNGNLSCGYSGVLTGRKSVITFYDDIFDNFDTENFMVAFWVYPIKTVLVENKKQTLFYFTCKKELFGNYSMVLSENYIPTIYFDSKKGFFTVTTDFKLDTDKWHHIAVSYSADNENVTFIHNGNVIPVQINKQSNETDTSHIFPQKGFQAFGNDPEYATSFSGVIDEIYVLKCNIPVPEVKNIANTCKIHEEEYCPTPSHGICPDKLPYKELDDIYRQANISQVVVTPLPGEPIF